MKITNNERGIRGVNAIGGPITIRPGETVEVDMTDAEVKSSKATGWFTMEGTAKATKAERKAASSSSSYEVRKTSPGWYAVFQGDEEVTKRMREDDVSGFDEFSEAEKADFVEANKAED